MDVALAVVEELSKVGIEEDCSVVGTSDELGGCSVSCAKEEVGRIIDRKRKAEENGSVDLEQAQTGRLDLNFLPILKIARSTTSMGGSKEANTETV